MSLRLGDTAPDSSAEGTQGALGRGPSSFSHPRDFTPVCPTELVSDAEAKEKFPGVLKALTPLNEAAAARTSRRRFTRVGEARARSDGSEAYSEYVAARSAAATKQMAPFHRPAANCSTDRHAR